MSFDQLAQRGCQGHKFIGPAMLNNFELTFNGSSPNWNMMGTANISYSQNSIVWGGLFEVDHNFIQTLNVLEHVPKRRKIITLEVTSQGKPYSALSYIIKRDLILKAPSQEYLDRIIDGAKDCLIPDEYIARLLVGRALSDTVDQPTRAR